MLSETIPGTNISYKDYDEIFENYRRMVSMTGGLSLSQICTITGLQTSTIQNWVKRSYVPHPENKKYYERHISRILLIASLKDCMNIEEIGKLMILINGDTDDTSDDIVSETKLYDYLCKIIQTLSFDDLKEESIDKLINKIIKKESANKNKLFLALKTMTYAYISGITSQKTNILLKELEK